MIRGALVAALLLAASSGCDSGFSIEVDIERGCLAGAPAVFDITVTALPSRAMVSQSVANPDVTFPSHRVVVVPPAGVARVTVAVVARSAGGSVLGSGSVDVPVSGHRLVRVTLTVAGAGCTDGGINVCKADGLGCTLPNAVAACVGSGCLIVSCVSGFADCDKMPSNGCEVSLLSDPLHCGGCLNACSSNHIATPTCGAGVCDGGCDPGYADCNSDRLKDGCEIRTETDAKNCSMCGLVCASGLCVGSLCAKRVFATSMLYSGSIGGLAGADAECELNAKGAALTGVWKAWLSDGMSDAATRLSHSASPYLLVDGMRVANDWAGLISGTLLHAIDLDQTGVAAPVATAGCLGGKPAAWTDTSAAGKHPVPNDCKGWTSMVALDLGLVGEPFAVDARWTDTGCMIACHLLASLYCIEQ